MRGPLGVSDIEALLAQYRQPAIMLHRPFPPVQLPRINSRLGGLPALPAGCDWPRSTEGMPLHFLAQIDCAELPAGSDALPEEGLLFFFARMDDEQLWGEGDPRDDCRVLFAPSAQGETRQAPADLPRIMAGRRDFEDYFVLPGEPPFKTFPSWPIMALPIQSWPDESVVPGLPKESHDAYQHAVHRARAAEAMRVTGMPPLQRIAPSWSRELQEVGGRPNAAGPDSEPAFPQIWIIAERIARHVACCMKLEEGNLARGHSSRHKPETIREVFAEAAKWVELATTRGLDRVPEDGEGRHFVAWLRELCDPEGRDLSWTGYKAIEAGLLSTIQHAASSPDIAARIPRRYFDQLEAEHAPATLERRLGAHGWHIKPRFHQMLGHAGSSQQARGLESGDVLLLQLVSDFGVNFLFWDGGEAEFWISRDDLSAKRFERAWVTICGA